MNYLKMAFIGVLIFCGAAILSNMVSTRNKLSEIQEILENSDIVSHRKWVSFEFPDPVLLKEGKTYEIAIEGMQLKGKISAVENGEPLVIATSMPVLFSGMTVVTMNANSERTEMEANVSTDNEINMRLAEAFDEYNGLKSMVEKETFRQTFVEQFGDVDDERVSDISLRYFLRDMRGY